MKAASKYTYCARAGKVASVLAMEVSAIDGGAVLTPFSQYPDEVETCWTACCYLENLKGDLVLVIQSHFACSGTCGARKQTFMMMLIHCVYVYVYICIYA